MTGTPRPRPRLPLLPCLLFLMLWTAAAAFSSGPPPPLDGTFTAPSRFRADCPSDRRAVRRFDPTLVKEEEAREETWVAVYRSANNLPSAFARDELLGAMRAATTAPAGDAETLVSAGNQVAPGVISNSNSSPDDGRDSSSATESKPVAVARLFKDADNIYILDSMRCILKKENTDTDCDGGSEHAEAIGVCIDELVLAYLQRCLKNEDGNAMTFHRGIHFRGTLVSGKLLDSRGFREVTELSPDMHSHESDFDGALARYAERSMSKEVAKNPGARDRALSIVSALAKVDQREDLRTAPLRDRNTGEAEEGRGEDRDVEGESDYDPWATIKKNYI